MARTKKWQIPKTQKLDPIYASRWIQMIHQRLIRSGKKKLAYRILQKSLENIQTQTQQDPISVIDKAIRNTIPSVEIQTRRIGGAVYPIPVEIHFDRGMARAIEWILIGAKKRSGKVLHINLANEFIDASKKIGHAFNKKEEVHKVADANARVVKK